MTLSPSQQTGLPGAALHMPAQAGEGGIQGWPVGEAVAAGPSPYMRFSLPHALIYK
jgi:hypothetical protein